MMDGAAAVVTAVFTCAGVIAGAYIYRLGVREGGRLAGKESTEQTNNAAQPQDAQDAGLLFACAQRGGRGAGEAAEDALSRAFENIMRYDGRDQRKAMDAHMGRDGDS